MGAIPVTKKRAQNRSKAHRSLTLPALRHLALLFLALTCVYHSNLRPIASGDSLPAAILPFSILQDHTIQLDKFEPHISPRTHYSLTSSGGHWYSSYPIAGPLAATPLYVPLLLVPKVEELPPGALIVVARIAEKFVAAFLTAITCIVLLLLLYRIANPKTAWVLVLVFALGTGTWSTSSQSLWQHTYGQLPIVICLYAIERWRDGAARWYWTAGTAAAVAMAFRPNNALLMIALLTALVYSRARWQRYVAVVAAPAAAAIAVVTYNLAVFHRFTGTYLTAVRGDALQGLAGILFSPSRGLFVYTPVVLFAFAALWPQARESVRRESALVAASVTFVVLQIATVSLWPMWWGGHCWGPRLLTEVLAPSIILIAVGMPALKTRGLRTAFLAVALYGCFVQAVGVYCFPNGAWDAVPANVDERPSRLWDWRDNPIGRSARAGIFWAPYRIITAGITGGLPAAEKATHELGIEVF